MRIAMLTVLLATILVNTRVARMERRGQMSDFQWRMVCEAINAKGEVKAEILASTGMEPYDFLDRFEISAEEASELVKALSPAADKDNKDAVWYIWSRVEPTFLAATIELTGSHEVLIAVKPKDSNWQLLNKLWVDHPPASPGNRLEPAFMFLQFKPNALSLSNVIRSFAAKLRDTGIAVDQDTIPLITFRPSSSNFVSVSYYQHSAPGNERGTTNSISAEMVMTADRTIHGPVFKTNVIRAPRMITKDEFLNLDLTDSNKPLPF
jgi:hypothetical protein